MGYGDSVALVITDGYGIGAPAAVVASTLRDVSGHGEPSSLSPRERALLNVEEAFRNTKVEAPKVVRLDDYRPLPEAPSFEAFEALEAPSFEAMDGGITKLQYDLAALIAGVKKMQDMQMILQMNEIEEELAATLLLLE